MIDETVTPAPEGVAPAVESTPKPDTQPRAPSGQFASKDAPPPATEPSATTEVEAAKPEAPEPDAEPKRNRVKERIDALTAEKHAALREANALKARLAALEQQRPRQVDAADYEGQQREQFRSVLREETQSQTAEQYQAAVTKAQEAQRDTFLAKVEAVRERIPDIDVSLRTFAQLPVSEHAAEIIAESDKAAEIAHYLAQNPREAYQIHSMSPAQQGRALAQIEQRFSLPSKRTSSAPPPPPIVSGANATATKSPSEMSAAEYVAMRKQQWAKGSR